MLELVSRIIPLIICVYRYWKHKWNVSNAAHTTLAPSLVGSGSYAAIEVEYRRGFKETIDAGFPATQLDIVAALASLPKLAAQHQLPLDFTKVVLLGHSAGGQLALLAADHAAKAGAATVEAKNASKEVVFSPVEEVVVPRLVVAISPVTDMLEAFQRKLSDEGDAAQLYMRGTTPDDSRITLREWQAASPAHSCLPLRVPTLLVSGPGDKDVPMDLVRRFHDDAVAAAASAVKTEASDGTSTESMDEGATAKALPAGAITASYVHFMECSPDADHYVPMDAGSAEWTRIRAFIDAEVAKWQ